MFYCRLREDVKCQIKEKWRVDCRRSSNFLNFCSVFHGQPSPITNIILMLFLSYGSRFIFRQFGASKKMVRASESWKLPTGQVVLKVNVQPCWQVCYIRCEQFDHDTYWNILSESPRISFAIKRQRTRLVHNIAFITCVAIQLTMNVGASRLL